jgi:hypothetical protein
MNKDTKANMNFNISWHGLQQQQQRNTIHWNQFLAILKLRLIIMSKEPLVLVVVFLVPLLKSYYTIIVKSLFFRSSDKLYRFWSLDMGINSLEFNLEPDSSSIITIPLVVNSTRTVQSINLDIFERSLNETVREFANNTNIFTRGIQRVLFDSLKSLAMNSTNERVLTLLSNFNVNIGSSKFKFGESLLQQYSTNNSNEIST